MPRDDAGEAEREGADQHHAEGRPVERDRTEQQHQCARARDHAARHAECQQRAPGQLVGRLVEWPCSAWSWRVAMVVARGRGRGRDRGGARAPPWPRLAPAGRAPTRCRIAARPSDSTSRPETRFSQGNSCSGRMNSDSVSVTKPSANTVAVCATVTVAPSAKACRARAAGAGQVRRHHGLAVAGRERVQRSPAHRDQQRHQYEADGQRPAGVDQRLEAAALVAAGLGGCDVAVGLRRRRPPMPPSPRRASTSPRAATPARRARPSGTSAARSSGRPSRPWWR